MNKIAAFFLLGCLLLGAASCEQESFGAEETPFAPYVLSLGVTSNGTTTNYVVTATDLMEGTINAVGKGLEQNGYYDYEQAEQTIFSIGGLGITSAIGLTRNTDGYLYERGDFVFNNSLNAFAQIDSHTMLGMEMPASKESGDRMTFYTVGIDDVTIRTKTTTPIAPMDELEWPNITGMCYSEGNVYITYLGMNPSTFDTPYTDTTYVAVYSYPEMTFKTLMKDTRTGPAGSWNAFNGIFPTEEGDMYILSNSSIANGFSQGTKNAAFLRIPQGATHFDADYYFDFETVSGGLKPAHVKYIGDGLLFAEVSTIHPQTLADRWGDDRLKCCIIDLKNKTVRDVPEIPIHKGDGGRRFVALVDGGYVYRPITTKDEGTYVYRIDPTTATAVRGAKVSTTFVGGIFRLE